MNVHLFWDLQKYAYIFFTIFNNNTMYLVVVLLKIKELKEETSVI